MSHFVVINGVLLRYLGEGGDVIIPHNVTVIGKNAFSDCRRPVNVVIGENVTTIEHHAFWGCNLTGLTMTKNTVSIGTQAFYSAERLSTSRFKVLSVPPGAGSKEAGKQLFCDEPNRKKTKLRPVVLPGLDPTIIKETDTRLCLLMGYCTAPKKYKGELAEIYQKEVTRRRKAIVEYAEFAGLEKVLAYFNAEPAPAVPQKLNSKEKVLLLEKTVLSGSADEVKAVLVQVMPVELSARALGFACRCRDLEIVKLLVEAGASFSFDRENKTLFGRYALYHDASGERFFSDFAQFCVVENVWNNLLFGDLDKMYPHDKKSKRKVPDCFKMSDPRQRAEIVAYLCGKGMLSEDQRSNMLYYAIMENVPEIAEVLKKGGARLTAMWLFSPNQSNWSLRSRFETAVKNMDAPRQAELFSIIEQTPRWNRRKLEVSQSLLTKIQHTPEVIASLLRNADWHGIAKEEVLSEHIRSAHPAESFALYLEAGFVQSLPLLDRLIQQSVEAGNAEITALLLNYKNTAGQTLPGEDSDTL